MESFSKKMNNFSSIISLIVIFISPLFYCPNVDAANNKELLKIVQSDQFLISGNIDFIAFNGENYLVSVGSSPISENTKSAKLNSIKEAKIIAQENLIKFIHDVHISSQETLTRTRTIKVKKGSQVDVQKKKEYIELIRERGEGIINQGFTIGRWKSTDGNEIYYAYGILIK